MSPESSEFWMQGLMAQAAAACTYNVVAMWYSSSILEEKCITNCIFHIFSLTLEEGCFKRDHSSRTPSSFWMTFSESLSLAHSPRAALKSNTIQFWFFNKTFPYVFILISSYTMHFPAGVGDWSSRVWLEAAGLLHCKLCHGSSIVGERSECIQYFQMVKFNCMMPVVSVKIMMDVSIPEFSRLRTGSLRRWLGRRLGLHWIGGRPSKMCSRPRVWLGSAWSPSPPVGRRSQCRTTLSRWLLSLKINCKAFKSDIVAHSDKVVAMKIWWLHSSVFFSSSNFRTQNSVKFELVELWNLYINRHLCSKNKRQWFIK